MSIEIEFNELCPHCNHEFSGITDEKLIGKCDCGEVQHICSVCPRTCGYRHDISEDTCEGCIWEHVCEKAGEIDCVDKGCPDEWDIVIKKGKIYLR